MGFSRARWLVGRALAVLASLGVLAGVALAQQKPSARATRKASALDAGVTPFGRAPAQTVPVAVSGASGSSDAGLVEAKTLDGGTRVFKFKELDIEGRLKSPQLVYFLRRVRAEFGAEGLGHRSFLREMSETRKESTF
jgi:hypothetical protein